MKDFTVINFMLSLEKHKKILPMKTKSIKNLKSGRKKKQSGFKIPPNTLHIQKPTQNILETNLSSQEDLPPKKKYVIIVKKLYNLHKKNVEAFFALVKLERNEWKIRSRRRANPPCLYMRMGG